VAGAASAIIDWLNTPIAAMPQPTRPQAGDSPCSSGASRRCVGWGSLARWEEDFKSCCMAAAGWGILARDLVNGKLYNVVSDQHEFGEIRLGQPLLVCDVYEHAFYVDYVNRKAEYVSKFVKFVDWDEVDRRFKALSK